MHIVICLDDRNGMLFNGRRLSSDKAVCRRILDNVQGCLWMNTYSAKLFESEQVCVDASFLELAEQTDTCFVENADVCPWLSKAETITIYRWNRHYPSDVKLPENALNGRQLISTQEFPGNSHDIVTEEIYA